MPSLQNIRTLARSISIVENESPGYEALLHALRFSHPSMIIGMTGPPGAGKSTLTDALIELMVNDKKKVGVLCVDPSSPFNRGALLGDRIRMSKWYNHPSVFIRSLASRGNMGGLNPKTVEITDIMKAAGFDYIIIETVGVGQSEVEIAGLADVTVVVLVPESGDDIQAMKAGLMEIADIFVVNKCDRPDAELFVKNLYQLSLRGINKTDHDIPVVETIALEKKGIDELYAAIKAQQQVMKLEEKKIWMLTERAYLLIQKKKMKNINRQMLADVIEKKINEKNFSIYALVDELE
jgi:GTPase